MGKGKRNRQQRRDPARRDQRMSMRQALLADRRHRYVPPTVMAYESAARHNHHAVVRALISRHNRRMASITRKKNVGFTSLRASLAHLIPLDQILQQLGTDSRRHPASWGGDWPDHIAWGVSSVVSLTRLVFAGQIPAAALLARTQLERWTHNLAFNASMDQQPGESTAAFMGRVWRAADTHKFSQRSGNQRGRDEPTLRTPDSERTGDESIESDDPRYQTSDVSYTRSSRREGPYPGKDTMEEIHSTSFIDAELIYAELSELMHGRGRLIEAARWETWGLLERDDPHASIANEIDALFADVLNLIIRRLRACIATLASEKGVSSQALSIKQHVPAGAHGVAEYALWPLLPDTGLSPTIVQKLSIALTNYQAVGRGERPLGRLYRDDELTDLMVLAHRAQVAHAALDAFRAESKRFGAPLNFDVLRERTLRHTLITEACGLISMWSGETYAGNAAAAASSSLRSAFWLWLEDDDRAMGLLRIVLEQTARLRSWRLKPRASQRLEDSSKTTPRDWLEAAGLKRLTALNRALGEIAHFKVAPRWVGARDLIIDLQPRGSSEEPNKNTGRGMALAGTEILLAREVVEWAQIYSPPVAAAFRRAFLSSQTEDGSIDAALEDWLDHVWQRRKAVLAASTFVGPAVDKKGAGGAT